MFKLQHYLLLPKSLWYHLFSFLVFFPCTTIDMAEENRKSFLKQFLLKVKMNLFKFSYFSIFLLLKIFMLKAKVFNGKITFPFTKLTMESKNFEKLNLKLNCNDMYENMKECAEQCYPREMSGIDCVAFLKDKFTVKYVIPRADLKSWIQTIHRLMKIRLFTF